MDPKQKLPGLYDQRFEHDNCGIGAVANIKGIKVFAAGGYYTAKGKGNTFTITVSNTTDRSYRGMKTDYRLCTFSAADSVGGAYSSWTKSKKYTVK